MFKIKSFTVIAFLCLALTACVNQDNLQTSTIEKILVCTGATADAWNGRHPGDCRVQLANGDRLTLRAPVAEGDVIRYDRNGYVY